MTNFSFWQRWLFVVGVMITIFGALMAKLSGAHVFDLFNRQIDPAFLGRERCRSKCKGISAMGLWSLGCYHRRLGAFMAFIAHYPFAKKERWAWNCIVTGLAIWFVLDTTLSIYHRVYFNAAFNAVLLILAGLPLAVTRRHFSG